MPLFEAVITKGNGSQEWSNRYIIDAEDLEAAKDIGILIVGHESDLHLDFVDFRRLRVSTVVSGDDEYIIQPLIGNGERSVASMPLPLFVTARVDFGVATGRPSRKYLRGVLNEADVAFETLETGVKTALAAYGAALVALDGFVDVDGQDIINYTVHPAPQMRQKRRGSKRSTTP